MKYKTFYHVEVSEYRRYFMIVHNICFICIICIHINSLVFVYMQVEKNCRDQLRNR